MVPSNLKTTKFQAIITTAVTRKIECQTNWQKRNECAKKKEVLSKLVQRQHLQIKKTNRLMFKILFQIMNLSNIH